MSPQPPAGPVQPGCGQLKSQADQLKADADQLRKDALASVGAAAWAKLAALSQKLVDLDRKYAELDACNKAHAGATACEVAFIDAGGGGVNDSRRAELWDLTRDPPVLLKTAQVAAGSFAFTAPVPTGAASPVAVVITSTDTTTATGPDFRSGPLDLAAVAASGASPRIEIVLGPEIKITPDDINRWFAEELTALQPAPLNQPGVGAIQATVQSVAVALAPSTIRLTATGTASGAVAFLGHVEAPMTATLALSIVPSTSPDVTLPAELAFTAAPHVDVAGPLAGYGAILNMALATLLGDWVLEQMRAKVRQEFTDAAHRALSLIGLPADATLSIRRLSIAPDALTVQPVIGAPGSVLSAYQPQPGDVVPV
jgi:hypothetical protein